MKDLKIPFAIVSFLLVQGAGAVWWASQVDGRVKNLETQSLNIAKENRRYIKASDSTHPITLVMDGKILTMKIG